MPPRGYRKASALPPRDFKYTPTPAPPAEYTEFVTHTEPVIAPAPENVEKAPPALDPDRIKPMSYCKNCEKPIYFFKIGEYCVSCMTSNVTVVDAGSA